jgi:hypothetical protein
MGDNTKLRSKELVRLARTELAREQADVLAFVNKNRGGCDALCYDLKFHQCSRSQYEHQAGVCVSGRSRGRVAARRSRDSFNESKQVVVRAQTHHARARVMRASFFDRSFVLLPMVAKTPSIESRSELCVLAVLRTRVPLQARPVARTG